MTRALQLSPADPQVAHRHTDVPHEYAQLLGTPTICRRLGIGRHTWRRWVVSGRAPAPVPNIPGLPRWSRSAIETFERGMYGAGSRRYFGAARRRSA